MISLRITRILFLRGSPSSLPLALAVTLALISAACSGGGPAEPKAPPVDGTDRAAVAGPGSSPEDPSQDPAIILTLFFPDNAGRLVREDRPLSLPPQAPPPGAEGRARATIEALLSGPRGPLASVIPATSRLLAFYLGDDGTAYVDLDASFARGLSRGSNDALLAIWSIANSLAVSVPEVRRTRIFVEGEEVSELGGHLDLTRPILPDMSLVRGGEAGAAASGIVP